MLISAFYILNLFLLCTGLVGFRLKSGDRQFSLVLIQILLGLPLLIGEYLYFSYHLLPEVLEIVLFSEVVFALIWLSMAQRINRATTAVAAESEYQHLIEIVFVAVVTGAAGYYLRNYSDCNMTDAEIVCQAYSPLYFSALFLLIAVLYGSWRIEQFWRVLNVAQRWEYKFLVVGSLLLCAVLAWSASYRLTYLRIVGQQLQLMAVLLFLGWLLVVYAVVRHRLLNRKIFISRKVVYSFVVPSLLAVYLFGFGVVSLVMREFGVEMDFVLKWLFLVSGIVVVGLFACSGTIRRRVHFFISTHFYINKYEYRDEWLALSEHLHGVETETDVIQALHQVLVESLYTTEIFIWLADSSHDYTLVSWPVYRESGSREYTLSGHDPLVQFLHTHSHFYLQEKEQDREWQELAESKRPFCASLNLTLLVPISTGNQLIGIIGLGPEFTGGEYGYDDFDLLTALERQTASALLSVRMAEKVANVREQQAWSRLSAFVLHDIKNAATMLSLMQENAPEHIHEPEFQEDMLELVADALQRMGRVEKCLQTLKDDIVPEWQHLELNTFVQTCCRRLQAKLSAVEILVTSQGELKIRTDPALLRSVLENIVLNASQALEKETVVRLQTGLDADGRNVFIEISDNGPGIAEELLPDKLFEPFMTTRKAGSGIGLWQVKKVVASLEGSVVAANRLEGGARFVIRLPLAGGREG
ncbi:MAG: PEP-CTERM system histidine kinase PrsK [Proteobacteria bacterium]|nr:PEP-CTERM system histidine kinase PrsK [Pseudomonadota bacterium]MBU1058176.1 PEP-CTERM system histidine kinase PrsK [Pseudomonadota bacterium]